jgi:hypothetical protein
LAVAGAISAGAYLVIGWGMHRRSRGASLAGLALTLVGLISQMMDGRPLGVFLFAMAMLWMLLGVRGVFAFHKVRGGGQVGSNES